MATQKTISKGQAQGTAPTGLFIIALSGNSAWISLKNKLDMEL